MATLERPVQMPQLGKPGEPCAGCGTQLAPDQRYCLDCGARRAAPRVAYTEALTREAPPRRAGEPARSDPSTRDWTPMIALGALGGLALVLIIGVLIGKTGFGETKQAGAPQVIRVGPTTAGGVGAPGTVATAGTASSGSVKSDWPSGKDGYTVELGVLAKAGSDAAAVDKAKSDANGKGAPAVGVLDSDEFKSLPGGKYVVYSGVFTSKSQAAAALKKLKAKFPSAQVVHVSKQAPKASTSYVGKKSATLSNQQLRDLNNLTPDQYAKRSRKLPPTLALPGKPPPVDNQAPGGGSGGGATIK
jgi:hypothetical protein